MAITYNNNPINWTTGRKNTVKGAIERIQRMLTRSNLSAQAVRRDTKARVNYTTHFTNLTKLADVQKIIKDMHERVSKAGQNMIFHYVPTTAAFNALGIGPLPAGVTIDRVEMFVTQRGIDSNTDLHAYFAPAFFTRNVYVSDDVNKRTGTGTFLHELSHGVGNTQDHAYTWQPGYATLTSAQRADNEAGAALRSDSCEHP